MALETTNAAAQSLVQEWPIEVGLFDVDGVQPFAEVFDYEVYCAVSLLPNGALLGASVSRVL